jgi:acyl transferase domain-containing protein/acyl carrier protein
MDTLPSLLVFGPQTSWPAPADLASLREVLISDSRLQPLLDAVKNLDALWKDLVAFRADLQSVEGSKTAQGFQQWAAGGDLPPISDTKPNILATPLTVLVHILQYFRYIKQEGSGVVHSKVLESTQACGIQGFCTGFLSAIAVATGKTEAEIGELSATSLRLAFAIGAMVDLEELKNPAGKAPCLAVRWRSEEGKQNLEKVLRHLPEAYISVVTDSSSVTVTVPQERLQETSQELSNFGLMTKPVEVHGRFHSAVNTEAAQQLKDFCASREELQIQFAEGADISLRSNIDSELISSRSLHEIALDSILLRQSNWYSTFLAAFDQFDATKTANVMVAGYVDSVPSSVSRDRWPKVTKLSDYHLNPRIPSLLDREPNENAVAVIGMSCKFPGADSVEEFWHLLNEGLTVIDQVPNSRFRTDGLRRTVDGKTPFWGSFVNDADAFDHEFFRKSPREAASMDPKQRMLLEAAYQALESSGQWVLGDTAGQDIGCYVGVATDDYYDNVNSHAPNAFSATGTLRAFLSGKVSHYFGWTGPSITYDTACSSSLVAIHAACTAIQKGECSRAVAGGVNSISSPNMYQNLAAATFLSKTGICKPFDAKADGYCRGEGVGMVLLKKLSQARADGNNIIGVIAGSATNQNNNETPITVPHSGSQMELYGRVLECSGIRPEEISYVEAHGTGTPVGDPRECLSIRQVFGGAKRPDIVHIGSAKGNIGHLEAASGVASLIKTLLMMQHETIPKTASFTVMNPNIPALEPDSMAISISSKPWMPASNVRVACVNNYGASGNNAAMILYQGTFQSRNAQQQPLASYPVFISAKTEESLRGYCAVLQKTIQNPSVTLQDVAYHLQRTQNRFFPHAMITKAKDISDLYKQLSSPVLSKLPEKTKPVILAFGGQNSTSVGLNENVYNSNPLLRSHIDDCDKAVRGIGLKGVLGDIFNADPIEDVVTLHACFFTTQYATAKSWIDAGLPVDALVGHSFGQLTALCVSGRLSLEESLKLVTGRATLMKKLWGPVRGSMVSVEASTAMAERLVTVVTQSAAGRELEIACYNGPTSHTLVGNPAGVEAVFALVAACPEEFSSVKTKKLNVTHGFHSVFTEPLLDEITALASTLQFAEKSEIHLETCSRGRTWTSIRPEMLAEHTRTPVYFDDAVKRLTDSFGPSTWVEAGTGSGVTGMVRRAIGIPQSALHSFETVQLNRGDAVESLGGAIANLWNSGYNVKFWPFYQTSQEQFSQINLPPYQFKKSRHWLPYLDALKPTIARPMEALEAPEQINPRDAPLISLAKYLDKRQEAAEFSINKHNAQFQLATKGHAVLDQALCPAGEYIELAIQAAMMLQPDSNPSTHLWSVDSLDIMAPLGIDTEVPLKLKLSEASGSKTSFSFQLMSERHPGAPGKAVLQATGRVGLCALNDTAIAKDFARTSRLIDCGRYDDLISDDEAELLQGSMVYKVFSKVVSYSDFYKGVRKVASKGSEVAAQVVMPTHSLPELNATACNSLAIDNFLQVAGMQVNCLKECGEGEVYIATHVGRIQPGAAFSRGNPNSWFVYSNYSRTGDRDVLNDIYVFDTRSHDLVMIIHDVNFTKVLISALARTIGRANITKELSARSEEPKASVRKTTSSKCKTMSVVSDTLWKAVAIAPKTLVESTGPETRSAVKNLVHEVADISIASMDDQITLEDLGIDSLMIHEVQSAVKTSFSVDVPSGELGHMTISSLSTFIDSKDPSHSSSPATWPSPTAQSNASSDLDTEEDTTATSVSGGIAPSSNDISKLAKFVAEQLGTTSTMSRETCLGDQGMDSLLSLELGSDIESEFGVHIEDGWLTAETTFGQLSDKVIPPATPTAPAVQTLPKPDKPPRKGKIDVETVMWKECGPVKLHADIFFPESDKSPRGVWSVGTYHWLE